MTRCGFVAVVGLPNAGKSTLLNRLVGQHLAITSHKPQSSRSNVVGLVSTTHAQLILIDTPGLLKPQYHLHRALSAQVDEARQQADVILYVTDGSDDPPVHIAPNVPLVIARNKIDLHPDGLPPGPDQQRVFPISARSGEGIPELIEHLATLLPEGPFLYDADDASTQPLRFFVTEAVREAAFELLEEELPYAIHCEVDEFRENDRPVYIRLTIFVERDSQKGILIGKNGHQIRALGSAARAKIEPLVQHPVYLDLWVKVLPNWRRNLAALARLGFKIPPESA